MPSFAGMTLSCSSLEDFVPCTLLSFEESSSSCPCCIEGFFLELLLRMPTLSWGVQWSACLVWPPLRDVGSLAPAPLLYEGLLPGAPLCTCPLYLGAFSGVPVCLASVVCLQFFSSCPCYIEGFFLELLVRMPTLFRGVQWSTYRSGPPLCDFLLAALASLLYRGLLPGASFACAHSILGHPVECLSVWPPSCDFFRIYFLKPRYPVVLGPGFLQKAVYLCL